MRTPIKTLLLAAILTATSASLAPAADWSELDRDAAQALQSLYTSNPAARLLGEKARAVLVFPNIVKAGFMFGGQVGNGTLTKQGKTAGHYNSLAGSSWSP